MKNMKPLICAGLIGIGVLAGGYSLAQTASAPAAAGSQPQTAPRYGKTYTPGWPMMSKDERAEYAAAMGQFKTRTECVTYMNKHFEQMSKRSLQRGLPLQGNSRRDLCDVLPN